MSEERDEEKYESNAQSASSEREDSIIFGGQIPRAATQVTGLTNDEKAKQLMTLSTSKVQTEAAGHMKPSPYVPDSNLFKFSNPDRPEDDLTIAQNQIYHDKPLDSQPTFTKPTAARNHGTIANRYAQHLTFRGDNSEQILFGRLNKSSCISLLCSSILSGLFIFVAVAFFPKFQSIECSSKCLYSEVPSKSVESVMDHKLTVLNGCSNTYLMFSFTSDVTEDTELDLYTFAQLKDLDSETIDKLYIGTDYSNTGASATNCWIQTDDASVLNGYVVIDDVDLRWEWNGTPWFMILSILMALFFVLIEWLFYSYNEIMIPRKDYRAYVMWYLIRIGWMSYMFAIVIAHSLMVADDVPYIIGEFDYIWIEADCYIATGYIALFLLICLCCCCFQESDGFSGGSPFTSPDDFGFEKFFLPQSRMDLLVINEFEQGLGTAMCTTMIFVIGFIICGVIPFVEFLSGGSLGYTYLPYVVSVWFLSIIVMTFQMCWFVRARCCGDEEDKRKVERHEEQIHRARSNP